MTLPATCPACHADLRGAEIPVEHREHFGGATHGSRLIGIYDRDRDRTVAWRCPDCGAEWAREYGPMPEEGME